MEIETSIHVAFDEMLIGWGSCPGIDIPHQTKTLLIWSTSIPETGAPKNDIPL
jgi:hypothetical protein